MYSFLRASLNVIFSIPTAGCYRFVSQTAGCYLVSQTAGCYRFVAQTAGYYLVSQTAGYYLVAQTACCYRFAAPVLVDRSATTLNISEMHHDRGVVGPCRRGAHLQVEPVSQLRSSSFAPSMAAPSAQPLPAVEVS